MNDQEFIEHFLNYLEDGLPENILKDKSIVQRILNTMMGEDTQLNFSILSVLRAWCRKMEIRIRIKNDNRIQLNSSSDLRTCISPFCIEFAISASSFFSNPNLLPLACLTCTELLTLAHVSTPQIIVDNAKAQLHITQMKIPLLEIIANSDSIVENLPICDPLVIFSFPQLHRNLFNLSLPNDKEKFKSIKNLYDQVQMINNGEIDVDRDLLYFCDVKNLFDRAPAEMFAGYPHPKVRKMFFSYAKSRRLDITQFSDTLICANIFDPIVKDDALSILKSQFETLMDGHITNRQLAHLQCLPVKQNSNFMGKLCDFINASDDFTAVSSWMRFLYHKDESIRNRTSKYLSELISINKIDLNEQPFEDHYVNRYKQYLAHFTKCTENPCITSLFDTILCNDQPDFIKEIAASKLIEVILNPSQAINKYLSKIRSLPFAKFPKLLHALSIRDGDWKINSVERLVELIKSITTENSMHLLPILTRTVFQPLLIYEGNGASLLKLPFFVETNFDVKGACSLPNEALYEPIYEIKFADILNEWVHYTPTINKPIVDGLNIPSLISLCLCDKILSADLLCQLDREESAVSKLSMVGKPPQIIYLLLIAVLCAKQSSPAAAKLCEKYVNDVPGNSMKLNQALIEFGGNCQLPDKITEFILDPKLRRTALSLVTIHMKFKKDISKVNIMQLVPLLEDELPINIKRQVMMLLVNLHKGKVDTDFMRQQDAVVKSLAFHFADLNSNHLDDALNCIFNQKEAICSRAAALEFIIMYYAQNQEIEVDRDFSILYLDSEGENLFVLQLLRFLSFPQIREQLMSFESFISPYLTLEASQLYANAALQSLVGYNITNKKLANCLTELESRREYVHYVNVVLSQLNSRSLQLFDSQIIVEMCKHIKHDDISLAFICINHLLLAGIPFPPESIKYLLSVYDLFIDGTILHAVLSHIFLQFYDCKAAALKFGILNSVKNEITTYGDNYSRFKKIMKTVSCLIYDFPQGQNALLNLWTIDPLIEFFDTSDTMMKFYLCYAYKNETTQKSFCGKLLDLVFDEFDKTRVSPPLLLRLIASILHSPDVRKECYKQKRIQKVLPRLNYAISQRDHDLYEGMLYIMYTLTCYEDGKEELFDKNRITDVFILMLSNQNITKLPIFSLLIGNLKTNNVTWKALTYATRRTNIELLNRLNQIGNDYQSTSHRTE